MLRPQFYSSRQRLLPKFRRQLGDTVYEVYAYVVESGGPQAAEGLQGAIAVVTAVHPAEDIVIERLHSHAHAGYAQFLEECSIGRGDVVRIDLHRELLVRAVSQRVNYALEQFRFQDGGRTPSYIKGVKRQGALNLRATALYLTAEFLHKKFLHLTGTDFRIEIAVGAETFAEGNVDVDHLSRSSALPSIACSV